MRAMEIQGYRVLYFERGKDGGFRAPSSYARAALACISTHDLPTLRGWWKGSDIAERERLGRFGPGAAKVQRHERERDRRLLLRALRRARLRARRGWRRQSGGGTAELPDSVLIGLHLFLARTRSRLVAVQLEDLVGMEEQANLPGTIDEHPNWRRKLPVTLEDLPRCRTFQRVVMARGRRTAAPAMTPPTATYRLQLRGGMTFARAATLAPQLAQSRDQPSLPFADLRGRAPARRTATTSPTQPSSMASSAARQASATLADACRSHGIGLILDFVPNHMAASPHNPWWRDVLEWGALASDTPALRHRLVGAETDPAGARPRLR